MVLVDLMKEPLASLTWLMHPGLTYLLCSLAKTTLYVDNSLGIVILLDKMQCYYFIHT